MIDPKAISELPAREIAGRVNETLQEHNRLVITAPPGAGKSTLLPLTILEGLHDEGKILMLEPRRLAARQIAERMASLLHEKAGETVGYRVRFESKVSPQTRIEVLTEGILTRMLVSDPTLEGVSTVIFDEFHERSLTSDLALALTRETQSLIRPDLHIVLMSATIDATNICKALDAPLVESKGKMFPVEIIHTTEEAEPQRMAEQVARTILQAHQEHEGDILAFLPGQAEIIKCQELLGNALGQTHICPLYGLLSFEAQHQAIAPSRSGERKVVLATPIAETSLTIEGVRVVVDSGFCRSLVFDPRNGLSHLKTQRISMDMATQRSGRAGRVAAGVCYRMWSLGTEHRMAACRKPEIEEADLTPMLLDIAAWGEGDVTSLSWLTPPPPGNVAGARQLLHSLGATGIKGQITALGKKMAQLPCHPRISRMLVTAETPELQALATDIASLLEEKDPLSNETLDSDINTRIALLRQARARKNEGRWSRILRIALEYRKMVHVAEDNKPVNPEDTGRLLALAYPERIARAQDTLGNFKMSSGGTARLEREDTLAGHPLLAIATLNASSGRIFLASPVEPESLSDLVQKRDHISWDSKRGMIVAQQEERIGSLILQSRPIQGAKEEIIDTLCQAAQREGVSMLDFSDAVSALQRRINAVALWRPELELPDLSTETVLQRVTEWLPLYLENNGKLRTTVAELKKINLCEALWSLLDYNQQQAVDRLAPTHITVPTGSRIRIDYRQGAEAPVLSVRLQECFGLTDTPRVNEGRQPVLMELLSPGFKPVQLTQDLANFWQSTYFEVRKELKRRYPKHAWPDDPLTAEATRRTKPRK